MEVAQFESNTCITIVQPKLGFASVRGLFRALDRRFESRSKAWEMLDLDDNGRISPRQFLTALRSLGAVGPIGDCFAELLGEEQSLELLPALTLRDVDPELCGWEREGRKRD